MTEQRKTYVALVAALREEFAPLALEALWIQMREHRYNTSSLGVLAQAVHDAHDVAYDTGVTADSLVDIQVTVGTTFTTARVAGQIVAVKWSEGLTSFYVADGTGPASKFDSERTATGRLMFIAMQAAGGGSASVQTRHEPGGEG